VLGLLIPDDGGSTHLWNVGRQLFYTVVYPRRQLWTSYWKKLRTFSAPNDLPNNLLKYCIRAWSHSVHCNMFSLNWSNIQPVFLKFSLTICNVSSSVWECVIFWNTAFCRETYSYIHDSPQNFEAAFVPFIFLCHSWPIGTMFYLPCQLSMHVKYKWSISFKIWCTDISLSPSAWCESHRRGAEKNCIPTVTYLWFI
jgi:hypothetical protein